jgi:hypothetical protein
VDDEKEKKNKEKTDSYREDKTTKIDTMYAKGQF